MLRTNTNVLTSMNARKITVAVKYFVLITKGDTNAIVLQATNLGLMDFPAKTSMSARTEWMVVNKYVRI